MAECDLPCITAIEGTLVASCDLCETTPRPTFNPNVPIPWPPSFDFGCYPFELEVDEEPTPKRAPIFITWIEYLKMQQTKTCQPKLNIKIRTCGSLVATVLADHPIELSGCQTIDGYYVCTGDLVLTIAQDDPRDNDIWEVWTGGWIRFETVRLCNLVLIMEGWVHKNEIWRILNLDEPSHGSDDIWWTLQGRMQCRLRLEDTGTSLSGSQTVDGRTTAAGDFILVNFPNPDGRNGIWMASDTGAWRQMYGIDPSVAPAGVPILSFGTVITVWDGDSAPLAYTVGKESY
jgi:hypothetical protein